MNWLGLGLILSLVVSVGCENEPHFSKSHAASLQGESEGLDLCAHESWYGDDVCDSFCVRLDPDCMEPLDKALHLAIGSDVETLILPEPDDFANIPHDPKNALSNEKVALGKLLYHETALGSDPKLEGVGSEGTYSCASCHHVTAGFQAGVKQGIAEGGEDFGFFGEERRLNPLYANHMDLLDVQPIRTPTTLNSAYQKVMLWNGQFGAKGLNAGTEEQWKPDTPIATNHLGFEGVETQAIAGFTVHRQFIDAEFLTTYPEYKEMFDAAFGDYRKDEDSLRQLTGLAIAAYERTLLANESPWQQYLRGDVDALTEDEKKGATLFFGTANCVSCHSGPALNSDAFYAIGMSELKGEGTFNTEGELPVRLGRASFTKNPEDEYKFKVPQLYNLKDVGFFGHGSTLRTVREVIEYKNRATPENSEVPESQLAAEFVPLELSEEEIDQLTAFIENALYDANLMRYVPAEIVSGNAFPVADDACIGDAGIMPFE